jgi:hypothetical protein
MARFRQFVEQMFVFWVVFIGQQVFKTKTENDSDIKRTSRGRPGYSQPARSMCGTHNLLRTGYAKPMLGGHCIACMHKLGSPILMDRWGGRHPRGVGTTAWSPRLSLKGRLGALQSMRCACDALLTCVATGCRAGSQTHLGLNALARRALQVCASATVHSSGRPPNTCRTTYHTQPTTRCTVTVTTHWHTALHTSANSAPFSTHAPAPPSLLYCACCFKLCIAY